MEKDMELDKFMLDADILVRVWESSVLGEEVVTEWPGLDPIDV